MSKLNYLIIFLLFIYTLNAQVGIGNEFPDPQTMLDITSPKNNKGILIPRLSQKQRDSIDTAVSKNGLLIFNTTENCFNYWNKIEARWISICGNKLNADFSIDCSTIKVLGNYVNDEALTSENKIAVTVHVTKPGPYTINAVSSPDNRYFFSKSGEFLSTGTYTIEIPGYGTPIDFTPENNSGDEFTLTTHEINEGNSCKFNVIVKQRVMKSAYNLDCSSISVKGTYISGSQLSPKNYIEATISFNRINIGAPLSLYTNIVDGIGFKTENLTLEGDEQQNNNNIITQTVKLQGYGIPEGYSPKELTIYSNSELSATCSASVPMTYYYDYVKLYATGAGVYNALSTGPYGGNLSLMVNSSENFGPSPNSIVKFKGWIDNKNILDSPKETELEDLLLGDNPPDILITGQTSEISLKSAPIYVEYLKRNGIVLLFIEDQSRVERFFKALYPDLPIKGSLYTDQKGIGIVWDFTDADSSVLNGPFGDIRGKKWGDDTSQTAVLESLPIEDLEIFSGTEDGRISAFKHKKYNLIFVGDGGFNSSLTNYPNKMNGNDASSYKYPMLIDKVTINDYTYPYYPIPKPNYGNVNIGGPIHTIYNSIFTANAIAWAIETAQTNGINSQSRE